ncbi:MAG TPA: His/Gly/Thr/Pro-type tRNA ligase C-terminal domain-containing protein, partial [Candidatus Nanoarchaeia archaeon]|nr:His/Gly/Thr/Pro-type tRNA ligase C-terminal domain-containing protein [Candidatus Nanoarchaeia archaeon]
VFEIFDREEKLRAIAGGGRYDKLVELYNGEPTPATGFGMGNVTLGLFLESLNLLPKPELGPDYFIASFPDVRKEANELIAKLRKKYTVDSDIMQRGLGKQLQYANSIGAKKLIVVGENEVKEKKLKVKDMKTRTEEVKNWNDF